MSRGNATAAMYESAFVLRLMHNAPARSVRSPPPCGDGLGVGGRRVRQRPCLTCTTPLPNPPPAGCGLARFRQILEVTKPRQAGVWLGEGADRVRCSDG